MTYLEQRGQFATPTGLLEPPSAQAIRLADVAVIGPAMILGGWKLLREHPVLGGVLILAGIGTVAYNGRNWWTTEQRAASTADRIFV